MQTLPCTPSGRAIGVSFSSTRSAAVVSVSCARRGECAAGGYYRNGSVNYEAFVVDETGGVWAKAIDVPGLAGLNIGGDARVNSISCSSAGNCAAGGRYDDGSGNNQAFVVEEKSGVWDVAIPVPDLEALNAGGAAEVSSISCASPGNCVAGGFYRDGSGQKQAFVAQETSGIWGSAAEVPGTADLNLGGAAAVKSVSCPSIGNCVAGGSYLDGSGLSQAFVVSEENDVWGAAIEVPGSEALNLLDASVLSVSCGSAGDCAAGGYYSDVNASSHTQAFVVNEENGVWGAAIEVPGSAALNLGDSARVTSISCASAGNCAAGGWYTAGSKNHQHPFLVNETGGTWGSAVDAPGIAALNGGNAQVTSISCAAATTCVAGGYFTGGAGAQAFVVSEMSGVWGTAIKVPGTATLNVGGSARVNAVSCVSTGECVAGGAYQDGSRVLRAFVTTRAASLWFASRLLR